ncbi:hypothetical protein BD309DRAFT_991369 [Dichomitus squalens]|uniref:Uncharacterized protein n=1 Tax=Dichomitus squalens TaxID=114155 RepID=A0A4Q9PD40_9APHY|nr:hypothetical protein BD309DRAFT_991369 [Dichomitus squalens]TBU52760.1 hypothetical protein BD310DRAFT_981631 [Dichomitus squalens]
MFSSSPALVGLGSSFFFAALVLALLPQAAARFSSIHFSPVKQCGNFSVDFAGGKAPAALPLSLTVLPVNGTPISIPLPLDAWNQTSETGAMITFLPFPAGTQFIASLDDAQGHGTALVSDVLVIDPPDSADTSCLPTDPVPFVPEYSINGTLSQCEPFSVTYDAARNISSPAIRAFVPRGGSFRINETESNGASGVDTYLMDVPRDLEVLLMFHDPNSGHNETTPILSVLGNVNSDSSCVPKNPLSTTANLDTSSSKDHVTPKIAIIVIAVCVGVVGVVALVMITWYLLHRRKVRRARKFSKLAASPTPNDPEKQMMQVRPATTTPGPLSPTGSSYDALDQYVRNPSYIRMGSALITPISPDPRDPFGEQSMGTILGPLSARDSFNSKLGATALGNGMNGSSTLALPPRSRNGTPSPLTVSGSAARQSEFDPATQPMAGTSPYWGGRLAVTPDNSLATNPDSILRRVRGSGNGSVSSVEIDRILEMATMYDATDIPELPQPVMTAPATLRQSAYMAGLESRRQSMAFSSLESSSPSQSRNSSPALSLSANQSTLRLGRTFREPPLAPLPSSPLPSPMARRSFDAVAEADTPRSSASTTRPLPVPPLALLSRNGTSSTRASTYSMDENDLDGFTILQPPAQRRSR